MATLPANWIESTPEWKACFGLIDGEEYLRLTAHYGREITDEHRAKLIDRNRRMWKKRKATELQPSSEEAVSAPAT